MGLYQKYLSKVCISLLTANPDVKHETNTAAIPIKLLSSNSSACRLALTLLPAFELDTCCDTWTMPKQHNTTRRYNAINTNM